MRQWRHGWSDPPSLSCPSSLKHVSHHLLHDTDQRAQQTTYPSADGCRIDILTDIKTLLRPGLMAPSRTTC